MFTAISRFFESPEDKDQSFINLTRNILIFTIVVTIISMVMVASTSNTPGFVVTLAALAASITFEIIALVYTLRGKIILTKALIPVALIITVTIIALNANSIHDISIIAYPLVIIIAALLQGKRALFITTPLVIGAIALLGIMDMLGMTKSPIADRSGIDDIVIGMVLIASASGILNLLITRLNLATKKAEENERAQLEANEELRKLKTSLEQRVQDRTSELTARGLELERMNKQVHRRALQFEALAQVTQTIISVHDLRELLPRIATVISENFDFYHVGVFLLDEANEYAVLSATNSDGGRKMLERKHRLKVGEQGIVGNVTLLGKPRIAMDVGEDAVFFDNPELSETHSEMALPLKNEERIIGALDVQSTESGAFTEEDIQMLSLLANQVSLAIENARLFEETRKALTESQAISRQVTREAWGRLPVEQNLIGYRFNIAGATPLDHLVEFTETASGRGQGTQKESNRVVVPIELRGETIGTLVVQSPSGEMNQDQMDLIKAVAERVAISAENARLFDETTRRAERERLVTDITGKIRSVNDPQAMMQIAIEELRNALGARRVEIIPQSAKSSD